MNKTDTEDELLNTQLAAERLQEAIHEPPGYWERYLLNNRRKDRNPEYLIPTQKLGGGIFYTPKDLAKFAAWEKSRRVGGIKVSGRAAEALRAVGFGEPEGSTTGRKLDCAITPQLDEITKKHFVQILVKKPLLVFRVEVEQAKEIRDELSEILACIERWTK